MPAMATPLAPRDLTAGRTAERAGLAAMGIAAAAAPTGGPLAAWRLGKSCPAVCQSVQPSRHTSESLLTRPSESHFRITSPLAGPYCPPLGGRTYQMAAGASAIGSADGEPPPDGASDLSSAATPGAGGTASPP